MGNTKDKLTLLDLRTEGDGGSVFGSDLLGGLFILASAVTTRGYGYLPFLRYVLMDKFNHSRQETKGRNTNGI